MSLNLRQIEIFRAVMITGSVSGAAQLLHVSQPAVSRLLSHTEHRLGFPLFERVKGRLYATPEAKRLFQEVEGVYVGVQRINELARDFSESRSGILRLVSHTTIGQMLLPEAIGVFHATHPNVKLTFECLRHNVLTERLLDRNIDLGITIFPVEHPNLDVTLLCRNPVVCVMPADHELARLPLLTLADLRPYSLISYNAASPFGAVVADIYQREQEPLNASMEVGAPQNACALVQAGAGIALVDEFSAYRCETRGQTMRPLASAPVFQTSVVHKRFEPMSQITHAFVRTLQHFVRQQGYQPV